MHELGIVVHITKTLDSLAKENEVSDISRVTLQIGKVSGIVPVFGGLLEILSCKKSIINKFHIGL